MKINDSAVDFNVADGADTIKFLEGSISFQINCDSSDHINCHHCLMYRYVSYHFDECCVTVYNFLVKFLKDKDTKNMSIKDVDAAVIEYTKTLDVNNI